MQESAEDLTKSSAEIVSEADRMLVGVIYSEDRSIQAESALRSLFFHLKDADNLRLKVLYAASGVAEEAAYAELSERYPHVQFIRVEDFRNDILVEIKDTAYVLFATDDTIFVGDWEISRCVKGLEEWSDALSVSLRSSSSEEGVVAYVHGADLRETVNVEDGLAKFKWNQCQVDVPLEIFGAIYRVQDIYPLLAQIQYRSPPTLESAFQHAASRALARYPYVLCHGRSRLFSASRHHTVTTAEETATLVAPAHVTGTGEAFVGALLAQGEAHFAAGDIGAATNCFEKILKSHPGHAEALNNLGVIAVESGDLASGLRLFDRAIASSPGFSEARNNLERCRSVMSGSARPASEESTAEIEPADECVEHTVIPMKSENPESQNKMEGAMEIIFSDVVTSVKNNTLRFGLTLSGRVPTSDPLELSIDIYPQHSPSHPERHFGFWNLIVPTDGTTVEEQRIEGSIDLDRKTMKLEQEYSNAGQWHEDFNESGDYNVHLAAYQKGKKIAGPVLTAYFGTRPKLEDIGPIVKQICPEQKLRSAIWFLTWKCNMKCLYCWEVQRIKKGELIPEPFKDYQMWMEAWNRLKPGTLDISGGEPFLQPGFVDFLLGLDDAIKVAITTNLSHDMTRFVQEINPSKILSMTLSYHPTQKLPLEHFMGRILMLKNRGFGPLTVNYVTWPEQLWLIGKYKKIFEEEVGVRFHVDPYAATPYHPYQFNEAEKQYIQQFVGADRQHWFGNVEKTPVACSGGYEHINVEPSGDAYRCINDKIMNLPAVGNILDPEFSLNDSWTWCPDYWRCPGCDKDKIRVIKLDEENERIAVSGPQAIKM